MPSYLLVSESKVTLLGPLFSVQQEDAVLKTFSTVSEILDTPVLPMGFVQNFDTFNSERMECISPFTFINRAVSMLEDLNENFDEMVQKEKKYAKQAAKSKKMHEESSNVTDNIEQSLRDVLNLKLATLEKIKEIFQKAGLQE